MDREKPRSDVAYLGCSDGYTSFSFGSHTIRFRTPRRLQRYTDVRQWDNGYLVVGAQYDGERTPVEEYLDLCPILENLYFNPRTALSSVKEVRLA